MREVDVMRTALTRYLDDGEDGLWMYLNRLCRDYGMEDGMACEIADKVIRDAKNGVDLD